MKRRVNLSQAAVKDLADLHGYLLPLAGARVARRYISDIRNFCDSLINFPERGTKRDDLRKDLRILSYNRNVTIALKVEADRVIILRILGRGRDLGMAFEEREKR